MNKRRQISLSGVRGFLVAVRHMSFTRAAEEFHLSQSALSRQIQGLEQELGRPLFVRNARHMTLTPAGEEFARAAQLGLKAIDDCVSRIQAIDTRRSVAVTTFASFASLWLIPRLAAFSGSHPDVDVNCIASDRTIDLASENVDVALRQVHRGMPEGEAQLLFREMIVPVCGTALLDSGRVPRSATDLADHTLLKGDEGMERSLPWFSWDHWLEQTGVGQIKPRATLRFTNYDQVVQAALSGQGIALARAPLVAELLWEQRLLMPLGSIEAPDCGYFLLVAKTSMQRPEVREFVEWIGAEAAQTRALLKRVIVRARGRSAKRH